jgi:anti-sigma regulatory factor (Ser/Thr protein kinase)
MTTEFTLAEQPDDVSQACFQFPSSKLGAHRARLVALQQLREWGWMPESEVAERTALLVAELAANAVTHGRYGRRGFQLRLSLEPFGDPAKCLRIEVSDSRGDCLPAQPGPAAVSCAERESGRGMLIVDAVADRWGVVPRSPGGKTLWCELDLGG